MDFFGLSRINTMEWKNFYTTMTTILTVLLLTFPLMVAFPFALKCRRSGRIKAKLPYMASKDAVPIISHVALGFTAGFIVLC